MFVMMGWHRFLSSSVVGGAFTFQLLAPGACIYELHKGVLLDFSISAYLPVRSTQQPQHFKTKPRVLGCPSDCLSATVAACEGLAASESRPNSIFMAL